MGIPLRAGRDFSEADLQETSRSVIVNQSLARAIWPEGDAIGHRISVDDPARRPDWFTVIGVVADARQAGWTDDIRGEMYFPSGRCWARGSRLPGVGEQKSGIPRCARDDRLP